MTFGALKKWQKTRLLCVAAKYWEKWRENTNLLPFFQVLTAAKMKSFQKTFVILYLLSFYTTAKSENDFGWNTFEKFISDKKIISSANEMQNLFYAQSPSEEQQQPEQLKLGPFQSMFPGSISNPPHFSEEQVGNPLILTPFLENGQIDQAKDLAQVRGISEDLGIQTYSGFFTVNKTYDSNLFFWYAPSKVSNYLHMHL